MRIAYKCGLHIRGVMGRTPHPGDHSPDTDDDTGEDTDDVERAEHGPIRDIFDIIERYYKGLKREDEGMGVD